MSPSPRKIRVVVVGAGVAGLAAAHQLVTSEGTTAIDVTVLEARDRVGGVVWTERTPEGLYEWGPEALVPTPDIVALAADAPFDVVRPTTFRYPTMLALDGRLRPLPLVLSPGSPPRPSVLLGLLRHQVLSPWGALRLGLEPAMAMRPARPGTVAQTYGRLLGRQAMRRLVAPVAEGVMGAPADVLADTVIPRTGGRSLVIDSLRRGRSPCAGRGLVALSGGMSGLVTELSQGLDVRCDSPARSVRVESDGTFTVTTSSEIFVADHVIVAVPPNIGASLLADLAPKAVDALNGLEMSSSIVVQADAPSSGELPVSPLAAGWLSAPEDRRVVASGSLVGRKWPHLGSPRRLRAVVRRPDFMGVSDDEVIQAALQDVSSLLGIEIDSGTARLHRWPQSLPIRKPDSGARAERAAQALPPSVHLAGTGAGVVGVSSVLASGRRVADRILHST